MREDFLYYIWKFKKFNFEAARTVDNELLNIIYPGSENELSGPDFFNAKIHIGEQLWAGNVEIHIKASDWYLHHHETDENYDNVILHVVWEDDADIFRKNNSKIPTLVLKDKVDSSLLFQYSELLEKKHFQLNCEQSFKDFSDFEIQHWLERLYFERLNKKSEVILGIFAETGNDWEATFFRILAKTFGLNINGSSFLSMARSFDFRLIRKLKASQFSLEALFLGQSNLITGDENYAEALKQEYAYLKNKHSLKTIGIENPKFFRLRPDNFPTIRLVQLATLYAKKESLFSQIIAASNLEHLYNLFTIGTSEYWQTHYNFGKSHKARKKNLTRSFIDLLIINCIVPVVYSYHKYNGTGQNETMSEIIAQIELEKNSTVTLFNSLRPDTAKNAMDSQALIQLKSGYCNLNKCLNCELGVSLLKKSPKYI